MTVRSGALVFLSAAALLACAKPTGTPPSGSRVVSTAVLGAPGVDSGDSRIVAASLDDASTTVRPLAVADAGFDARASAVHGGLFVYEEGDDSFWFVPPRTVVLERGPSGGGRTCTSELSDHGNMYTGGDVEKAWRDAEVQKLVARTAAYMSPNIDEQPVQAKVRASVGWIAWTPFCGGLCVEGPKSVTELLRVLHVVMRNRRTLCP